MDVAIRRLHAAAEILGVLTKFNEVFPRSISSRIGDLSLHAEKLRDFAFVYAAEIDGVAAGFVAFYANDAAWSTAFLTHIAVDEASRGTGIGLTLMEVCLKVCRGAGMKRVKLEVDTSNARAIAFYESLAFSHSGLASPESCFMTREAL